MSLRFLSGRDMLGNMVAAKLGDELCSVDQTLLDQFVGFATTPTVGALLDA